VFLDSGAFTAWTRGAVLPVVEYARFVLGHPGHEVVAVMDDIEDPAKTWANQKELESYGVEPLPCFHYGEDVKWLSKYLDEYPYLAIGGMVRRPKPKLVAWLDSIMRSHICDAQGKPRVRLHGFGATGQAVLARYPWYSVDSSSWIHSAASANVLLWRNGRIVSINTTTRDTLPAGAVPFYHLSQPEQDEVYRTLVEDYKTATCIEDLDERNVRLVTAAETYRRMVTEVVPKRFARIGQRSLLDDRTDYGSTGKVDWEACSLYLAGEIQDEVEQALRDRGQFNRLFTYFVTKQTKTARYKSYTTWLEANR